MIQHLKLRNFRSIRELDLELRPLNVLIGRNASGKSNFLSFFQVVGDGIRGNLNAAIVSEIGGFHYLRHLNADAKETVQWQLTFDSSHSEKLRYETVIGQRGQTGSYIVQSEILSKPPNPGHDTWHKFLEVRDGRVALLTTPKGDEEDETTDNLDQELAIAQIRNPARYPALAEAFGYMRSWTVFNGFGEKELRNIRAPQVVNVVNPLRLAPDGSNLVSLLWALQNQAQYEATYERLEEVMTTVFPDFKRFDMQVVAAAQASLSFRSADLSASVPAFLMSDGQLRFLGLVILLLLPNSPDLILIDEPEIGMHPKMIDVFAELLKEASKRTQIIVATHSPQLIDSMNTEDLMIVERDNGETSIRRPDMQKLQLWLERYSPGYLWTHTTLLEG